MKTVVAYTTSTWNSPLAMLRLVAPLRQAGLTLLQGSDLNRGLGDRIFPEKVDEADAVIIQRDFPAHPACRGLVERTRAQGKPLIFELDDLLFDLPPEHPDRRSGYYISALLPMLQLVTEADLITVSNAYLGEMLKPFNPNISLLPNFLDDTIWSLRQPRLPETVNQPLRIGYMGGETHQPDLALIAPVLKKVSERYAGQVAFHFLGISPPDMLRPLPDFHWQPVKTMDYAAFVADFLQLDWDIALAPLVDSSFNRGKSAIKFLEYTALGVPGIYSALGPYAEVIRHGETGLLATNLADWEAQLCQLIEEAGLRQTIASQAQNEVRQHWLLSNHAYRWRAALEQVAAPTRSGSLDPVPWLLESIVEQINEWQKTQEERIPELTAQLSETKQALQFTSQTLNEIESSTAWKLVRKLWGLQTALRGSKPRPVTAPPEIKPLSSIAAPISLEVIAPSPADHPLLWQKRSNRYDVILLPVMDWASRVQRPQQLTWQFANAGHRVFYLHPIFRQDGRVLVKLLQENIFEVHLPAPTQFDIYQKAMPEVLRQTLASGISRLRSDFGILEAVLMVDLPFWKPLALSLRQKYAWKVIYDCMDYHRGFSSNAEPMLALEDELIRESDLIIVASYPMRDLLSPLNPQVILAPNGADFDHFRFGRFSIPPEMADLPRPIIGYFGAISDWFDAELVRDLAQARPEWSFVLIGSTLYGNEAVLRSQRNIHLLGEKRYAELPAHLHAFDVAIIPLKKTPLTQLANQLKLFEYLSAGKPVVSTDLNDMHYYTEQAFLASTHEEWLAGIEQALAKDAPEFAQSHQEFASQNTWQQRFTVIQEALRAIYPLSSISIPAGDELDSIRLCLHSIFLKTDYPNYEVLVTPTVETTAYLQTLAAGEPRLKLVNDPVEEAKGETIIFLDHRCVVTYGWLTGLLRYLRDPDTGLIAPVTNTRGITGIPVDYPSLQQMDDFAFRRALAHFGETTPLANLPRVCFAVRRVVYNEYAKALLPALKARNLALLCAQDVFVHHWG